eukprot:802187-Pelagomonas_calceolata.AAC.1
MPEYMRCQGDNQNLKRVDLDKQKSLTSHLRAPSFLCAQRGPSQGKPYQHNSTSAPSFSYCSLRIQKLAQMSQLYLQVRVASIIRRNPLMLKP